MTVKLFGFKNFTSFVTSSTAKLNGPDYVLNTDDFLKSLMMQSYDYFCGKLSESHSNKYILIAASADEATDTKIDAIYEDPGTLTMKLVTPSTTTDSTGNEVTTTETVMPFTNIPGSNPLGKNPTLVTNYVGIGRNLFDRIGVDTLDGYKKGHTCVTKIGRIVYKADTKFDKLNANEVNYRGASYDDANGICLHMINIKHLPAALELGGGRAGNPFHDGIYKMFETEWNKHNTFLKDVAGLGYNQNNQFDLTLYSSQSNEKKNLTTLFDKEQLKKFLIKTLPMYDSNISEAEARKIVLELNKQNPTYASLRSALSRYANMAMYSNDGLGTHNFFGLFKFIEQLKASLGDETIDTRTPDQIGIAAAREEAGKKIDFNDIAISNVEGGTYDELKEKHILVDESALAGELETLRVNKKLDRSRAYRFVFTFKRPGDTRPKVTSTGGKNPVDDLAIAKIMQLHNNKTSFIKIKKDINAKETRKDFPLMVRVELESTSDQSSLEEQKFYKELSEIIRSSIS